MNKKKFSPYIRVAMHSKLLEGTIIKRRVLFDYEMIFVSGGECKITIDKTPYICKKNDVVFIRPGVSHKFECFEDKAFVQPHIHFDVCYSDKSEETPVSYKEKSAMSEYELSLIQEDFLKDVEIPDVFVPYDIEKFKKVFYEVIRLFSEKKQNFELLYKAELLKLLGLIFEQFEDKIEVEKSDSTILSVKNYIDSNYLSVITLDALAVQFHINKFTLLRKFKAAYNQNVIAYYHTKRVQYAKRMLEETSLSVYALSEKLNFGDIYSFSRFFKKQVGVSPTEYKKHL